MLESLDAFLKELFKCLFLVFMEIFKLFLVFDWSVPNFIGELIKTWSFPFDFLIVCFNCLLGPLLSPFFDAINQFVSQILFSDESAISLSLSIFKERSDIILEMVVLDLRNLHFYRFICSFNVSFELYSSILNCRPRFLDLSSHNCVSELFELLNR